MKVLSAMLHTGQGVRTWCACEIHWTTPWGYEVAIVLELHWAMD